MEAMAASFKAADSQLTSERGIYSGTTAVVSLLMGKQLYTANVGDSRAVLSRAGRAVRLTYDHKGCDPKEQARVREAGGFVINERVSGKRQLHLLLGMLAVTRALGDSEMKEHVSGIPYCTRLKLNPDDGYLILACDGLWDVCSDQEAIDYIKDIMDPQDAAEALVDHALDLGSADNLSVICVYIKNGKSGDKSKADDTDLGPSEPVDTK